MRDSGRERERENGDRLMIPQILFSNFSEVWFGVALREVISGLWVVSAVVVSEVS